MKQYFVLVSVLLFVVACSGGTNKTLDSVYTGTQGLQLNFVPNFPPNVLYSSALQQFATGGQPPIILEVKNRGAITVGGSDANLFLSGFDPSVIQGGPPDFSYSTGLALAAIHTLRGKTTGSPEGDFNQYTFSITGVMLPEGTDNFPVNLLATACYRYQTKAAFPVCIDPNPYSSAQKACNAFGSIAGGGSQGAPVAITAIQQEPSQGRSIFKISIANVGGGRIIRTPDKTGCLNTPYAEQDVVRLSLVKLGNIVIDPALCSNVNQQSKTTKLINNQATIVCKIEGQIGDDSARTVPFEITLDYAYANSVQKSLQIKRIIS